MAKAMNSAWVAIIATDAEANMVAILSKYRRKLHNETKRGLNLKVRRKESHRGRRSREQPTGSWLHAVSGRLEGVLIHIITS